MRASPQPSFARGRRGLVTCFDADDIEGDVIEKVCSGIDEAELVLVCISQEYIDKVGGKNGALDTCKKEFEYAERTKGADKLVAVVTDPAVRNPRDWRGSVGMVLGSRALKDFSMDESDPAWEINLYALYDELVALRGEGGGRAAARWDGVAFAAASLLPSPQATLPARSSRALRRRSLNWSARRSATPDRPPPSPLACRPPCSR